MWRREPVLIGLAGADAAVVGVLSALMALDVLSITGEQLAAVSAAVVAVTTLAAAVIRASVYSPATHEAATRPDPADVIAWGGDV